MSKKLVMSVLFSLAMSIGGFFVSCGGSRDSRETVVVQLPEGCMLIRPKDELGSLTGGTPIVQVKPGRNEFEVSCGSQTSKVSKEIAPGQHTLTLSEDDLR